MPASESNVLELAKNGDPKAIAFLINRQLAPKGITAKVSSKDTCLQIFLESNDVLNQDALVAFIKKGILNLGVKGFVSVKVYGRPHHASEIMWTETFSLNSAEASQTYTSSDLTTSASADGTTHKPTYQQPHSIVTAEGASPKNTGAIGTSFSSEQLQDTLKDFVEGLKVFVMNPVAGLPLFYRNLGKQRALMVGAAFGIFYVLCLLFTFNRTFAALYVFNATSDFGVAQVVALGATQFISFAAASILTRKICRGFGSPEGDVFIAGTALLAPGLLMLLSSIFGLVNFEIIIIISILSLTYLILTLYTGCSQISQIPDSLSPLAVVFMLLLSLWFSKIIISSGI